MPRSGCWTWCPSHQEGASSEAPERRQLLRERAYRVGSIGAECSHTARVGRQPGQSRRQSQFPGSPWNSRLARQANDSDSDRDGRKGASAPRNPAAEATAARVRNLGKVVKPMEASGAFSAATSGRRNGFVDGAMP